MVPECLVESLRVLYPAMYREQLFISGKERGLWQQGWLGKFTPDSMGPHSTGSAPGRQPLQRRDAAHYKGRGLVREICRVQAKHIG